MFIKFENKHVQIFKLKQGTIVEYELDYYHIHHVYKGEDGKIRLTVVGAFESLEVLPEDVTWLEQ